MCAALGEFRRLALPPAEEVELRAADLAGLPDQDLLDARRVDREDALDALALDDATDGERGLRVGRRGKRNFGWSTSKRLAKLLVNT